MTDERETKPTDIDELTEEFPTSSSHDVPSFVGQPPGKIPGDVPPWLNLLLEEIRSQRTEVLQSINRLNASLTMHSEQFDMFRTEARSGLSSHALELKELRDKHDELEKEIRRVEARMDELKDDGK